MKQLDESQKIEDLSVREIVDILIQRGINSNGFGFVSRSQMETLVALWREEQPQFQAPQWPNHVIPQTPF